MALSRLRSAGYALLCGTASFYDAGNVGSEATRDHDAEAREEPGLVSNTRRAARAAMHCAIPKNQNSRLHRLADPTAV